MSLFKWFLPSQANDTLTHITKTQSEAKCLSRRSFFMFSCFQWHFKHRCALLFIDEPHYIHQEGIWGNAFLQVRPSHPPRNIAQRHAVLLSKAHAVVLMMGDGKRASHLTVVGNWIPIRRCSMRVDERIMSSRPLTGLNLVWLQIRPTNTLHIYIHLGVNTRMWNITHKKICVLQKNVGQMTWHYHYFNSVYAQCLPSVQKSSGQTLYSVSQSCHPIIAPLLIRCLPWQTFSKLSVRI